MRKNLCFIAILLTCACSVKENRSECPCELVVRSEEVLKTEGSVLVSVIQEDAVVKQGMMSREDFEAGRCRLTVPRKPSTVTVFSGITDMNILNGRWLDIRFEHQCDELYSCSEFAPIDGEIYDCVVTAHKNFVRLYLTIIGMPEGAEAEVRGSVQGYDIIDHTPFQGSFACTPVFDEKGAGYCVRLPRQTDDDLTLDIIQPGKTTRQIAIGDMISASGYRYDDPDLLDISITVDLSKSNVVVTVADWTIEGYKLIEY